MSDHDESEECTCGSGIPPGAVVLNTLYCVEYLDPDSGGIYKADLSHDNSGTEIDHGKLLEMISFVKIMYEAPIMAEMVMSYMEAVAEDDE